MDRVLLTVEEAADCLGVGRTKVFELISAGRLGSVRIGRCRRVPRRAIEAFVDSLPSGPEGGYGR